MKYFGHFFPFLFFFSLFSLSAFSQTNVTLSGVLIDKANNEPILAGSVELMQAKDSIYVDGIISNANGEFSFRNLKAGNYILKVTYIGYLPLFKNINLSEKETVSRLGKLFLEPDEILLKEAIVEGKRPEMIVKNDTTEYDAASFKTGEDAVVEDLLKKLPGVEVDKDGKVTAQGKSVNKMFVNGKEFFSDDPQVASKNMPADMIEKVQVYDRKSEASQMTGFDNGEEETIINLTVRAGMMQGTIGNVQLGLGQDVDKPNDLRYNEGAFASHQRGNDRYTLIARANNNNGMGGADIMGGGSGRGGNFGGGSGITQSQNYMTNINKEFSPKLTLNGDIRYSKQERKTFSDVTQVTFSDKLNSQRETISRKNYNAGENISSNLRLEWKPNEQNTLIFRPNIRFNQNDRNGTEYDTRINLTNENTLLDSKSLTLSQGNSLAFGGNLDYSYKFSKVGRVFSISARGNYNTDYSQPQNITYYPDAVDHSYSVIHLNQHAENESLSDNYSATVSFVEPVGNNNFIQLLYRYSFSETDNENTTYNILPDLLAASEIDGVDTAIVVESQSRTIMRNTTNQRIGLNFKIDRKKFNLTFGFNVDPSNAVNESFQPKKGSIPDRLLPSGFNGKLPIIKGDSLISSIPIKVVNYSPVVNFRYMFGQRSNLRVTYEGDTEHPTPDQLRDYPYVDINRPNDVTQGNPDLKPSYISTLRVDFNKYVPETQLMYSFFLNGGFTLNDIISITLLEETGRKNLTTYKNMNGNWNASFRGVINLPLSKKFSVGSMLSASSSNRNSYVGDQKNTMQNQGIMSNLNFRFQPNDNLYVGTNGMINYSHITYTAVPENNRDIYNYTWGMNVLWTFLSNWTFESDINSTWRNGYAAGYNVKQMLWNASISKQIFKKQFGTGSLKLQIFDILKDRKNISSTQTASDLQFSQTNVIPSYFMVSFLYKFSIFPKSSFLDEGDMAPRRWEGGPGRFQGGEGRGGGNRQGGGRPF